MYFQRIESGRYIALVRLSGAIAILPGEGTAYPEVGSRKGGLFEKRLAETFTFIAFSAGTALFYLRVMYVSHLLDIFIDYVQRIRVLGSRF